MKIRLSKEEKRILDSFEKGEWVTVKNPSKRKSDLIRYARTTLKKDKRLNIRISERDLLELQKKAIIEGLPYQTYISSIIHKFVNGKFKEMRNGFRDNQNTNN
ncbi:MAG: antitoxin [Candidatus Omnitrophica bacterium]|jgi:predicted DNA binding CopG/RHH family protein|nr:antitoxin [Candidatus Omnitrophota bacterium]